MSVLAGLNLEIERPEFLGTEHWDSISLEITRFERSVSAGDYSQALGDLKCLVEAIARVAYVLEGEPAKDTASFSTIVKHAHNLLSDQPGYGLTRESPFKQMADQARKMVGNLGEIRNDFGGGHGRATKPKIDDEMLLLATDGALTWARWAVRRLGYFSEGRPAPLIRDLIDDWSIFRSGDLRRRLESANLRSLEPRHQRELGVAVGQRTMQGTFVVQRDGVKPCIASDDLSVWPENYRYGLLTGLWFSPTGKPTITPSSIKDGILALDPIPDSSVVLSARIDEVCDSTDPGLPECDAEAVEEIVSWLNKHAKYRPASEAESLKKLRDHLNSG